MNSKLTIGLILFACAALPQSPAFAEVSITPSDTILLKPFLELKEMLERPDNKTPEAAGKPAAADDNGTALRPDNESGDSGARLKDEFERFRKGDRP